jgi:hypothetical protein
VLTYSICTRSVALHHGFNDYTAHTDCKNGILEASLDLIAPVLKEKNI